MILMMLTFPFLLLCFGFVAGAEEDSPPLFVFSQVVSLSNDNMSKLRDNSLEAVMQTEVRIARCQVGCLQHWSHTAGCPRACGQCQHVCRLLVETPAWYNICSAPGLCREGCGVACAADMDNDLREPRHIATQQDTTMDIRVIGCRLVWQVDQGEEGDISLYLVSSEDRSGRFYHLATVRHNYVRLVPGMLTKTQRFIILVIGEDGIRHRQHLEVAEDDKDCDHGMTDTLSVPINSNVTNVAPVKTDLTLPISILSSVSVLFILALIVLIRVMCLNCQREQELEDDKFDNVKVGIDNDFKIYTEHEDCIQCQNDEDATSYYVSEAVEV